MPLNGRYTASDMISVLNACLTAGTDTRTSTVTEAYVYPYFYQGSDSSTLVFAPVTDNPDATIGLESLSQILVQTKQYCDAHNISLSDKKMVFPVVEAQPFLGFLSPRNHFVTLYYDPKTRTATVVDSRPWWAAGGYSLEPIRLSLVAGLSLCNLPLSVDKIEVHYQAVQHDNIHCGAWTAANIQAFAEGQSLNDRALNVVHDNVVEIKQYQVELVKKNEANASVFRDVSSDSDQFAEKDDFLVCNNPEVPRVTAVYNDFASQVKPEYFRTADKARWMNEACAYFRAYFNNRRLFGQSILASQSVMLNGAILTEQMLGDVSDLPVILLHSFNTPWASDGFVNHKPFNKGYELAQPEQLGCLLKSIEPSLLLGRMVYEVLVLETLLRNVLTSLIEPCLLQYPSASDENQKRINQEIEGFTRELAMELVRLFEDFSFMDKYDGEEYKIDDNGAINLGTSGLLKNSLQEPDADFVPVHVSSPDEMRLELTADFQLNCIQALAIAGGILCAIAVLTCPPVVGALGLASVIGSAVIAPLSAGSAVVGSAALLVSAGLFGIRACFGTGYFESDLRPSL